MSSFLSYLLVDVRPNRSYENQYPFISNARKDLIDCIQTGNNSIIFRAKDSAFFRKSRWIGVFFHKKAVIIIVILYIFLFLFLALYYHYIYFYINFLHTLVSLIYFTLFALEQFFSQGLFHPIS